MSDPGPRTTAPVRPIRRRVLTAAFVAPLVIAACGAVAPFLLDAFWLQVGLFAMAAAVAALGLELLIGQAGQLSLAHSFFIMIGAYAYTYGASDSQTVGVSTQDGLGLPPIVAVLFAVLLSGAAGLAFSPDRGTSARRVPRRRVARARVPRPAHPVQLAEHHRRVQRPRRPSVHAVRLHVRRHPRRDHHLVRHAVHPHRQALVRRARRPVRHVVVRAQRAAEPRRPRDAGRQRWRDRGVGDGRAGDALQGLRVHGVVDDRGPRRRRARARVPPHRARDLRRAPRDRVRRDGRDRRPRLRGRRDRRRVLRLRAARGAAALQQRPPVPVTEPDRGRPHCRRGGALPLRRGDRRGASVRAGRARGDRPPRPPPVRTSADARRGAAPPLPRSRRSRRLPRPMSHQRQWPSHRRRTNPTMPP